ncbi:jg26273 [Pararge aegeria aegeria]|uniref:Jg26273 protein n=1 Tax=Pararge aegeria aegeria TaxID=348720 RepID=A0A8S4QQ81_9NEOP|nr:jg26273 [Pararge aegeria aegeria]
MSLQSPKAHREHKVRLPTRGLISTADGLPASTAQRSSSRGQAAFMSMTPAPDPPTTYQLRFHVSPLPFYLPPGEIAVKACSGVKKGPREEEQGTASRHMFNWLSLLKPTNDVDAGKRRPITAHGGGGVIDRRKGIDGDDVGIQGVDWKVERSVNKVLNTK